MRDTSLIYPVGHDGKILLGHKKRGMGKGKWNGFGGKREDGESMRECAARELFEESGLIAEPGDFLAAANLYFHQPSDPEWSHGGIVYFLKKWKGKVRSSDEMEPAWFSTEDMPFEQMWQADRIWLPRILKGEKIRGVIYFAPDGEHVFDYHFETIRTGDIF